MFLVKIKANTLLLVLSFVFVGFGMGLDKPYRVPLLIAGLIILVLSLIIGTNTSRAKLKAKKGEHKTKGD